MLKSILDYPHFVFRPSQVLRRIGQKLRGPPVAGQYHQSTLPWGLPIRYRPDEHIGKFLYHHGFYDLCVSEVLYRLADPGEVALDVGANIGQMSSILAARCGPQGRVHAFEPHPEIHEELSINAALWKATGAAPVKVHRLALSDVAGVGHLSMSSSFDDNRGTASLVESTGARTFEVPLQRLDEVMALDAAIGVMKLDVEGHELGVLKGATRLLERSAIRDIVFEDYGDPPTPVMKLLQSFGYQIFSVESKFFGLEVMPTTEERVHTHDAPPNYLATLDPERSVYRLSRRGWAVFGLLKL